MEASVVIVGDEILAGHVQDANAHFIASRLAEHGHALRRVSIVSDDPADIAAAVRADVDDARVEMSFICGGLGPTHDDRTMEGISVALGVSMVECKPIADRIEQIAGRIGNAFSSDALGIAGLMKMAQVPDGAEALECASGVIPAATMLAGTTRLVILPGPPRDLQRVFNEAVEPVFLHGTGQHVERAEIHHDFPESALAAALAATEAALPAVKIGSYPLAENVLIRVAGPPEDVAQAVDAIRAAIDELARSDDGVRLLQMMRTRRDH